MKNLLQYNCYRLEEAEKKIYGISGDSGNGVFKIFINGRSFFVIASNGGGWEHVSISPAGKKNRCPTWEEMCAVKDMFFEPEEVVMQLHPAHSEYVNNHPYCLHLWRPLEREIPLPPVKFV